MSTNVSVVTGTAAIGQAIARRQGASQAVLLAEHDARPLDAAASALRRVGTPEEIASAAGYVLGPDAGVVTGSELLIDGDLVAALGAGRRKVMVGR